MALVWLLAPAGLILVWPRWWWMVGALAVILSQIIVLRSWSDAKYGTIANRLENGLGGPESC